VVSLTLSQKILVVVNLLYDLTFGLAQPAEVQIDLLKFRLQDTNPQFDGESIFQG
jgi:hypothetical protein